MGTQLVTVNAYYKDATNMLDETQLLNTGIDQPYNFATGYAYGVEFSTREPLIRIGRTSPTIPTKLPRARESAAVILPSPTPPFRRPGSGNSWTIARSTPPTWG